MKSLHFTRATRWVLLLLVAAGSTACTMDQSKTPTLSGPSEFGLSIDLRATPDVLARDGASQSVIRLFARDASGKLTGGKRFVLSMSPANGGTLSTNEVVTGADGIATAYYTSAAAGMALSRVTIGATPVSGANDSGNADNSRTQTVAISLQGANAAVSTFTISPTAPKQFDLVTFDASGTTLNGAACMSQCTFRWTFGNEGTATGEVVTHRFEGQGTHTITLTVTGPDGVVVTLRKTVTVSEAEPPEATIQASTTSAAPGQTVRFTGLTSKASGGAKIVEYNWDFGNGETAEGPTVSTTFDDAGSYLVTLTVKDSNGQLSSSFAIVNVEVPAP